MALINLDPDGWLHIIEMVGGGALGTKMLRVLMETRDSLKDLGVKEPATGLFRTVENQDQVIQRHENWLVQLRAKLGVDGVSVLHVHQRDTDRSDRE